ncbi:MAG: copper resistance protein B [Proteobacteria bacterium]|nr:MAG: copper resistance protein B [Pseudomonadota bacterium]
MGHELRYFVLVDQAEFRAHDADDFVAWEVEGWVGGDHNRAWFRTEGDRQVSGDAAGEAELEVLYGRFVAPFWDARIGIRQDLISEGGHDRGRTFLSLGVVGLAPQWFEVEPTLYVSHEGDISFRLEATYDLFLTQRLVLQPRFELDAAASQVSEFGVGSGINDVQLGLRLRYEIRREIAPYVGVTWNRQLGNTAELARDEGEGVSSLGLVAGVRFWF